MSFTGVNSTPETILQFRAYLSQGRCHHYFITPAIVGAHCRSQSKKAKDNAFRGVNEQIEWRERG
jgi:hypothetical protein